MSLNVALLCHVARTGHGVLGSLRAIGATTYLIHDSHSASLRYANCHLVHAASDSLTTVDDREIVDVINGLHRQHPIDHVIGADFESLMLLGRIRPKIAPQTFPMGTVDTLSLLNDKWAVYRLCREIGVDVPKSMHVLSKAFDLDEVVERIGFPLVIKPVTGFGQREILYIADRQSLTNEFLSPAYQQNDVIVQEFIPGQDWGMSVFARDGQIINWSTFRCPNYQTTILRENPALYSNVAKIIRATTFTGVANFDARIDARSGKIVLFECNPRFFLRLTALRALGLDFVTAGVAPERTPTSLTSGEYFHWRELFHRSGLRAVLQGKWRWPVVRQEFAELAKDLPVTVARRLLHEESERHVPPNLSPVASDDGPRFSRKRSARMIAKLTRAVSID